MVPFFAALFVGIGIFAIYAMGAVSDAWFGNSDTITTSERERRLEELEAQGVHPDLHLVGKKGIGFFKFTHRAVASQRVDIGDRPSVAHAAELVREVVILRAGHRVGQSAQPELLEVASGGLAGIASRWRAGVGHESRIDQDAERAGCFLNERLDQDAAAGPALSPCRCSSDTFLGAVEPGSTST